MDVKYSVIIPTLNRPETLARAVSSVERQDTHNRFEIIIVDDGSTTDYAKDYRGKHIVIRHKQTMGKGISRNDGMKVASGEWICWLDDDDEYLGTYMSVLDYNMVLFPKAECFNFGALVNIFQFSRKNCYFRIRETFKPQMLEHGHEPFASGKIGTGSFVFKRDLLGDKVCYFPDVNVDPWSFAEIYKEKYSILREYFPGTKELGNPFGDDYAFFFELTRLVHSIPIDALLYIQYVR